MMMMMMHLHLFIDKIMIYLVSLQTFFLDRRLLRSLGPKLLQGDRDPPMAGIESAACQLVFG